NTTADWIGIKASFTLDGKKECAVKSVALVKVDVGPVNFTTPGKASERNYGHTVFVLDPPAAPAIQNWVTTNDPGSDWGKFIYNGKEQRPEPTEGVSSQLPDHDA